MPNEEYLEYVRKAKEEIYASCIINNKEVLLYSHTGRQINKKRLPIRNHINGEEYTEKLLLAKLEGKGVDLVEMECEIEKDIKPNAFNHINVKIYASVIAHIMGGVNIPREVYRRLKTLLLWFIEHKNEYEHIKRSNKIQLIVTNS